MDDMSTKQRIIEYILNDLPSSIWYKQLLLQINKMKKMGCNDDDLLNIYENIDISNKYDAKYGNYGTSFHSKNFRVIIFEINWSYIGLETEIKEKIMFKFDHTHFIKL